MMHSSRLLLIYITLIICTCLGCGKTKQKGLTIATAANCEFTIKKIALAFEKETNIPCEVIVGSSGKLSAQIHQGAPYDVFVSADMYYPTYLYDQDLTIAAPEIYAYGQLVLWSIDKNENMTPSALKQQKYKRIAIPNPKTAPYGKAATEVLASYGALNDLKNNLVYGESVSQINQFIHSKSVDAAFTSRSTLKHISAPTHGQWTMIPTEYHAPMEQGIVVLRGSKESDAQQFKSFILSNKAQLILKEFGYLLPK